MAWLGRHANELEMARQKRVDQRPLFVPFGKAVEFQKNQKRQATQFILTVSQQHKQIEMPRVAFFKVRSHELSGFEQTGNKLLIPRKVIVSQTQCRSDEQLHVCHFLSRYSAQDISFCVQK